MSYVDAGYGIVLCALAVFSGSLVWRERSARARGRARVRTGAERDGTT